MRIFEHITTITERAWAWFAARADSKYAIFWLCLLAYLEPFISPVMPEALLVAMIIAKREHWKLYTTLTIIFCLLGGVTGYVLGMFFFQGVSEYLLSLSGFEQFQDVTSNIKGGDIFLIMFFISFTLLPDKPFTYLSGFLGVPFLSYISGLFLGRSLRVLLVGYLSYRFGPQIVATLNKYFYWFALAVLAILLIYGTLRWHLLPWF